MDGKLNLDAPIKSFIMKVLSREKDGLFGISSENDHFFGDLIRIGCDFYDTLALFADFKAVNEKNIGCIIFHIPEYKTVDSCTDKTVRKMIPHWTPSRYHTASIEDICRQVYMHMQDRRNGVFVYNSNLNTRDKKAYNYTYILIISDSQNFFFDINRKKTYKIGSVDREVIS